MPLVSPEWRSIGFQVVLGLLWVNVGLWIRLRIRATTAGMSGIEAKRIVMFDVSLQNRDGTGYDG